MKKLLVALGLFVITAPLWAQVSKTFSWQNATTYVSGGAMPASDIKETRILVAPTSGGTATITEIAAGAVQSYVTLPAYGPGQWFFRARHVTQGGVAGELSTEGSFTVGTCQANPAACRPNAPTNLQAS